MKRTAIFVTVLLAALNLFGQVRLPQIVRDSMILQRDAMVNIWGWSSVNEKVQVLFNGKSYKTKGDASGKWLVKLPATRAGGPYTIDITASNKISIKEVLFGDIWFCSGQSNMVHQLNIHDITYAKDIAEANYPMIRQFWIPTLTNLQGPQTNLPAGYWNAAVGENVRPFSAVAYFFAKKIYERYKVPVGIINASVGGTPIEAWTSEEGFKDFPMLIATIEKNKDTSYLNSLNRRPPSLNTNRAEPPVDAGMNGAVKWFDAAYIPKGWHNINIPGYWEDQGVKDLNGIVWYRKEIDIPATMIEKPAKVFLGRIVDADELYINGSQVGRTTYMYPQRRYPVPAGVLKPGKNIFVVRVTNTNGKGGFVPDKPYCIFAGNDTIDLKGTWQYKVGTVFRPVGGGLFGGGGGINAQNQPAALYNAMVAPVINYCIKGFCWYQGESNTSRPQEYERLLPALIYDWRNKWNHDSLPFLYVQLPGYTEYNYLPSESNMAILREAQLKALSVPKTAMAVAIDLGEWNDIHPDNKKDVGERLALAALKLVYGETIVGEGPAFKTATIDGKRIVVSFTNTGTGLVAKDGEALSEFAIAGPDKKFVWAKARIEGDKVVVWNDEIADPAFVRYSWADNPVNPNLFNTEGLPASPFRTDK
ncbi:MAG: sialate O-acetylesterase [Bacteroidota bacterium]